MPTIQRCFSSLLLYGEPRTRSGRLRSMVKKTSQKIPVVKLPCPYFGSYSFFPALYGVLFESEEEAAFSNYRLWESLGFIFAYILQTQVCIYSKLWVILFVLLSGMLGYLVIEAREFKMKKARSSQEEQTTKQ